MQESINEKNRPIRGRFFCKSALVTQAKVENEKPLDAGWGTWAALWANISAICCCCWAACFMIDMAIDCCVWDVFILSTAPAMVLVSMLHLQLLEYRNITILMQAEKLPSAFIPGIARFVSISPNAVSS
jgi:hypothetical protein